MKIFKYLKKYWVYAILAPIFMVIEVMMDLRLVEQMSILVGRVRTKYGRVGGP